MQKLNITKNLMLVGSLLITIVAMLLTSAQAHAEYLGFPTGRSADISTAPTSSFEVGFVTGDLGDASFQNIGGRFNLRTSEELIVFFDVVQAEVEDADGLHTVELEDEFNREGDFDVLAIEGLFSGEKIGESNLRWYANLGIHTLEIEDTDFDETELGFGGGVVSDTSFGEFYAGVDLIDELTFGFGIRYHLQ